MWHQFTAAAERALVYASNWSNEAGYDELEAGLLLVGLLTEPECRAARMLAELAIDIPSVLQRWPELADVKPPSVAEASRKPFSKEVGVSLQLARQRLAALPQPLELATEHLLLGLAAADHEVSEWLQQQGLDPDTLEAEIHKLYGCEMAGVGDGGLGMGDEGWGAASTFSPSVLAGESFDDIPCFNIPTRSQAPDWEPAIGVPTLELGNETSNLRILDAAANRAREGLRVIEDYVRFVLDDPHLTGLCKQLRHDLTVALGQVSLKHRLAARETQADVGTVLTTPTEQSRSHAAEVVAANFARLQESLRSLEEFGKLTDPGLAAVCKQLRYRTYTLQRTVHITRDSIERLAETRLYVLIDGRPSVEEFERLARELIDAGVHVLQLRDKQLDDRELLSRARLLRTLTRRTGTLFVMNDRPDLAVLAQADGIHVGQEEMSVKDARSIVGPEMLVGVSIHSIEQARHAVLDGASYIGVGPTFPSGTKRFERFPGVELLRQVAAEIRLPAFAIGGIGRKNVGEVLAAGFTRIAVGGAIMTAKAPMRAVKELIELVVLK